MGVGMGMQSSGAMMGMGMSSMGPGAGVGMGACHACVSY